MTYLDKYPNCNGCPVAKYCGKAVSSIKLCHSYKEPDNKTFMAISSDVTKEQIDEDAISRIILQNEFM